MVTNRMCFAGKDTRECMSRGYGTLTQSGTEAVERGALIPDFVKETGLRRVEVVLVNYVRYSCLSDSLKLRTLEE